MSAVAPSIRTTVRRLPERGVYDRAVIVRSGGPKDDAEDHALDVWAGVVPLALVASAPIADSQVREGIPVPAHARCYQRPRRGGS
jgi:hypothetical protein